jgi:aromatic-L-amino-acid decarboxylase
MMSHPFGDMSPEEFRRCGHQVIDWLADFFAEIDKVPVLPDVRPGDIGKQIGTEAPVDGEPMDRILADVDRIVMPGMTHWNHPSFFAYFSVTGSAPGILADLFATAFNINGMVWKSCPAATEVEQAVLIWLRKMVSLPEAYWGITYDTASVSSLHALAAAREWIDSDIRNKGLSGIPNLPRLRLYASDEAHSSIDKAALTLGLGLESICKIPVDDAFQMQAGALRSAIQTDRENGWVPFCVVATIGTTSTTSVDPVQEIAKICRDERLWLHVDAAYAGPVAMLPEKRHHFEGWQRADSIVLNPHKWLFVPIDCSVLFTRHKKLLKQAFALVPEYLKTGEDAEVDNLMDYGIQLGRRFRALKMWFVFRYFGTAGITERLRFHIALAAELAEWISSDPGFELMAPVPFSTVCFRAHPEGMTDTTQLEKLNQRLLEGIDQTRRIYVSHTRLKGHVVLRFAIGNLRTERRHVVDAWQVIRNVCQSLLDDRRA